MTAGTFAMLVSSSTFTITAILALTSAITACILFSITCTFTAIAMMFLCRTFGLMAFTAVTLYIIVTTTSQHHRSTCHNHKHLFHNSFFILLILSFSRIETTQNYQNNSIFLGKMKFYCRFSHLLNQNDRKTPYIFPQSTCLLMFF